MNKLGIRVLTAVVASSMVILPVSAAPSIDELKQDKQAVQGEVNSLQKQLTEIISKIDELERQLVSKGEQIQQATVDLEKTTELEKQQYADMKLRIKYMYEEGNTSAVEALLSCSNFSELVNKAEYVQNVHDYDREKLQEYIETKEKVADLKATLESEQKELESLESEFQSKEEDLNVTIADKQDEVENLDEMIQVAVEQAAAEEAARKAAEEAAARAAEEARAQQEAENDTQDDVDTEKDEDTSSSEDSGDSSGSSDSSDSDSSDKSSSDKDSSSSSASSYTPGDAVSRAYSALGKPYSWGAVGPDAYDCSGLVSFALTGRHSRVYTSGSLAGCTRVDNPQPGDVCVRAGHVGIYIGNGQMIHAPQTGDVVKVAPVPSSMWYVRP